MGCAPFGAALQIFLAKGAVIPHMRTLAATHFDPAILEVFLSQAEAVQGKRQAEYTLLEAATT